MPFDIFTMAALRDELESTIVGTRVDKVLQPSELAVALKLWRPEWSGYLLVSAAAGHSRVYVTTGKMAKGFETPSAFLMLLRKYCTGARIQEVNQPHLERILRVELTTSTYGQLSLISEVMGNHSNIILAGQDGLVLGAIKLVGPKQSRSRRIVPHALYEPPPPQMRSGEFGGGPKIDPLQPEARHLVSQALSSVPGTTRLGEALVGLLRGCSPALAAGILTRVGRKPQDLLNETDLDSLGDAVEAQYAPIRTRHWSPVIVRRDGAAVDFMANMPPYPTDAIGAPSMSAAVEAVSEGLESSDAMLSGRTRVKKSLERRRSEVQSRITSLRKGLERADEAQILLDQGNLLLGFQYEVEPGESVFTIRDSDMQIALDPTLSPVENAEKYFKRFRKARDAGRRIPTLLAVAESDLEFVEELDAYVDMAETPGDLTRVEFDLEQRFASKKSQEKKKPPAIGKVLTVDLGGGVQVLVGRSARQNEEVTFKLAGRGDLWLHARGFAGSHTVLRGIDAEIMSHLETENGKPVKTAASLAAYYSKARQESAVDVIVARVRDIHRVSGGAPGQVTVRQGRTVRVSPRAPDELEVSANKET